ncbi:MAG: hypothetical protein QGG67_13465 [Gammaproteobacteria bacterium]|jgi:hypothetical protein|nr:hypothetical protein [Gammaproteobacteria bacterium]MDP6096970.1 hypothetical protein [Gammaproteobacteria bacterium]MDP7455826.1 hypothetical protein [Gammaproteobacteria bacterium]HJO12971.1 hypothetical protein [Gammaproteobacteria bacterium]|tara:strand:+ start:1670 stop:2074 length:405 start_codon:yes stop_codon:yes gene_type:complete
MGSQNIDLQCWKCGTELKRLILPFSRYEECSTCKADLHACMQCRNYKAAVADACTEDRADFVLDKDKANFCDFFKPNKHAYKAKDYAAANEARSKLAAIFGEEASDTLNESSVVSPQSEADQALAELQRLFDDD